jgi:hypothetical protein
MKNTVRKLTTGLAVVLIAGFAFVCVSAYRTYRTADARLGELKELAVSKNPTAQFEVLRRKYGVRLHPLEGCTQRLCQYEIDLSNQSVAALRIVPYT